jgi:opacity protein-like surface antigen
MITTATRGGLVAVVVAGMAIAGGARRAAAQEVASPGHAPASAPHALLGVSGDLSGYGIRHVDEGYEVLGNREDRVGVGLEASYDTLRFGRSGRLAFGLGFVFDRVGPSQNPSDLQISFEGASYYALAQARWRQDHDVQPYLSLGAGLTHASLSIGNHSSGELRGKANTGFARAGGGVRFVPGVLMVKKDGQRVLGFTLSLEGGAVVGGDLGLDLRSDSASPGSTATASDPIVVDPTRAGDLGTTATYVRMGVGLVF